MTMGWLRTRFFLSPFCIHARPTAVYKLHLFSILGFASSVLSHSIEDPIATNTPSNSFSGPLEHYNSLIESGVLQDDQQQRIVLQDLDLMQKNLKGYSNEPASFILRVRKYFDSLLFFPHACCDCCKSWSIVLAIKQRNDKMLASKTVEYFKKNLL